MKLCQFCLFSKHNLIYTAKNETIQDKYFMMWGGTRKLLVVVGYTGVMFQIP